MDNGVSYTGSNNLLNVTVSGSLISSDNNAIYVKDYLENVVTQSFSSWYPGMSYTYLTQYPPCGSTGSSGEIYIYSNTAASASVNGGVYKKLPGFYQNATTSSTILLKDIYGCTTSSILDIIPIQMITSSLVTSSVSCYGGSNGSFSLTLTNIFPSLNPRYTVQTGSYILPELDGIEVFTPSYTFSTSSLPAGVYTMSAYLDTPYSCNLQNYLSYITITSPTQITFTSTASYIDSCSNAMIFNATGGVSPYNYYAQNSSSLQLYTSDSSSVNLDGLNAGDYNLWVVDSNFCTSPTQTSIVYGRGYIYSGSQCEEI